jgi:hypothetical protein
MDRDSCSPQLSQAKRSPRNEACGPYRNHPAPADLRLRPARTGTIKENTGNCLPTMALSACRSELGVMLLSGRRGNAEGSKRDGGGYCRSVRASLPRAA